MKLREFIIPDDLRSARSALKKLGGEGLAMAGGTSLHFMGDNVKTAVDISRLGLSGIKKKNGAFLIGATSTLDELAKFKAPGWALGLAARRTSTQQIRNISTLGGNIVRVFPWADFPVALLALDATMHIAGKKERAVKADEFFEAQPARLFKAGDLLLRVETPALKKGQGFGYVKQSRVEAAFSMMTAAALLTVKGGRLQEVRVAVGAGVPFPRRLEGVEAALKGQPADAALFERAVEEGAAGVSWKGKEGMSDEYAAHLACVTIVDALAAALRQAKGGAS